MRSWFGDRTSYAITGTIGIKRQSIEAFHVTSTDMNHYLDSVKTEIERYVDEMFSEYHRDYPDDETEFSVDIDLDLTVID